MQDGDENEHEWLSLGAASRLLGVNADSLRRWANTGRVACITTPGGHRRFSRRSLQQILEPRNVVAAEERPGRRDDNGRVHGHDGRAADPQTTPRTAVFAGTAPLVAAAYRRAYVPTLDATVGPTADAAGREVRAPELDRAAFRVDGRRLVAALLRALDAADHTGRADAEAEAMGIAGTHARRLADAHVPLADAVRMFIRARRPFLAEIRAIAHRQRLDPSAVLVLYDDASGLLDRLLIAFVAAHGAPARTPARHSSRRTIS